MTRHDVRGGGKSYLPGSGESGTLGFLCSKILIMFFSHLPRFCSHKGKIGLMQAITETSASSFVGECVSELHPTDSCQAAWTANSWLMPETLCKP